MAELRTLSGVDIEAGTPANFIVHTGPRPREQQIRVEFPTLGTSALHALARARCFFLFRAEAGPIVRALVFVPASLDEAAFRHCAVEETTQALGLPNDLGPADSIFNDGSDATGLTPIDRLLLRLLYAPELRAGMQRSEATTEALTALERLLAR